MPIQWVFAPLGWWTAPVATSGSIKGANSYDEELSFDYASRRRSNAQNRVLRARMRSVIGRRRYGDGQSMDIGLRLTNLRRNGANDV